MITRYSRLLVGLDAREASRASAGQPSLARSRDDVKGPRPSSAAECKSFRSVPSVLGADQLTCTRPISQDAGRPDRTVQGIRPGATIQTFDRQDR